MQHSSQANRWLLALGWPKKKRFFTIVCLATSVSGQNVHASSSAEELFELPLEALADLRVQAPAVITRISSLEAPASTTRISADQIKRSPARNILDLIEIYVPGAWWMNSEKAPVVGVRGGISDLNLGYLLIVNDRVLNSKAHYGAKSELEQWNLTDIDEIVVIRGPGSVTYGAGAISGVIKITTKNARNLEEGQFSLSAVEPYQGLGFTYHDKYQGQNWDAYWHASYQRTQGHEANHYIVAGNTEFGYIGEDVETDSAPLDYFADYQGMPQVKLHFQSHFGNNYTVWARYTQQGSTWRGNEAKTEFNGQLENQQSVRDRQFVATLKHDRKLSDSLSGQFMLSFDSFDAERRGGSLRDPNPDNALNFKIDYSEHEIFLRSVFNWMASSKLEVATGVEYSHDFIGAGWGDSKKDMRLGENNNIVNGPDSNAIREGEPGSADRDGPPILVGNGWETDTIALFTEANYQLTNGLRALASLRVDKNTYSDYLWSPRVSLIKNLKKTQYVKFIAQQSQRVNTAAQLLLDDLNGEDPEHMTITGYELAYSSVLGSGIETNAALFYNEQEVLSNSEEDISQILGDLKFYGLELDFQKKSGNKRFGLSYSYLKQLDWYLNDGLSSSGVSYSDYNVDLDDLGVTMTGVGNDLNNWANQYIKSYVYFDLNSYLSINFDARYYWDMQGAKDGLSAVEQALEGTEEEEDLQIILNDLNDKDVYESEFRLNTSVNLRLHKDMSLDFYIQNLWVSNDAKRYAEDSGNTRSSPRRVRFVEEPTMYSLKFSYRF